MRQQLLTVGTARIAAAVAATFAVAVGGHGLEVADLEDSATINSVLIQLAGSVAVVVDFGLVLLLNSLTVSKTKTKKKLLEKLCK